MLSTIRVSGIKLFSAFIFVVCLFGCGSGGGSGGGGNAPGPYKPPLVSISVGFDQVFVGSQHQFTATAKYSDGSTADLTASALWTSSTPTVATVASGGLVAGVATGQATITAASGAISGQAALNVNYPWVSVSAGNLVSAGIKSDGSLWTWGYNTGGQLGESRTTTYIPVRLGTGTWRAVSVGTGHVLAIKSNGTLWAWGENLHGELGNEAYGTTYNLAQQIGTDTTWVSVSAGDSHSHAIKSNGTLWAWGRNSWGELGDGTIVDKYAPIQIGTATDWSSISAGDYHCVGLKTNGALFAWGDNGWGQRGDGTTNLIPTQGPTQIDTATGWLSARARSADSLAIKADSTLWAWGGNLHYVFGNGTHLLSNPTPTQIGISTFHTAAPGYEHSLAIKSDGTLWACGTNDFGQTGLGLGSPWYAYFTQVGTDAAWSSISAGGWHSLAIKSDSTLWAWGDNQYGELGAGDPAVIGGSGVPVHIYY